MCVPLTPCLLSLGVLYRDARSNVLSESLTFGASHVPQGTENSVCVETFI